MIEAISATSESLRDVSRVRDTVACLLGNFPIVRRKDEEKFGDYRTKLEILEIYDAMQESVRIGQLFQTRLDPPPGPPTDAAGNFIPMAQWETTNWPPHIHQPRSEAKATIKLVNPA